MTAADIYWAPYLERLNAYVPTLHRGLKFRSGVYDAITEWFDAMDARVPAYACRVKGRAATWQQVLAQEHPELQQEVEPTTDCRGIDLPARRFSWAKAPGPNPSPNPSPNPTPASVPKPAAYPVPKPILTRTRTRTRTRSLTLLTLTLTLTKGARPVGQLL